MDQFIKNHRLQVLGTLSGWDRIRFRGTFRVLSAVPGLFSWLCGTGIAQGFQKFAMKLTDRLRASVKQLRRHLVGRLSIWRAQRCQIGVGECGCWLCGNSSVG